MTLDFQQVRQQIKQFSAEAVVREHQLTSLREQALSIFNKNANNLDTLRSKVTQVSQDYDPNLRCAFPVNESLDAHFPTPGLPRQATILAADGSQISPDRHAEVFYGLVNVGAIQILHNSPHHPKPTIQSNLLYGEQAESLSEPALSLMRDLSERKILGELAKSAPPPVITFTDGPIELWIGRESDHFEDFPYQKHLEDYLQTLRRLLELNVITAGYVDKPAANLIIRMLEVGMANEQDLPDIRNTHPLKGVVDRDLFEQLLKPGERSAVFGIQSQSAKSYQKELALHFFYLNVGKDQNPSLARVEIPAWVAKNKVMLDDLHAILIQQCRLMGTRPYPYLLHRAHETAVVSLEERDQVTQMILLEFQKNGLPLGKLSNKQGAKNLAGRTRIKSNK